MIALQQGPVARLDADWMQRCTVSRIGRNELIWLNSASSVWLSCQASWFVAIPRLNNYGMRDEQWQWEMVVDQ